MAMIDGTSYKNIYKWSQTQESYPAESEKKIILIDQGRYSNKGGVVFQPQQDNIDSIRIRFPPTF